MSVPSESLPSVTMQELQEMSHAIRTLRILQGNVQAGRVSTESEGLVVSVRLNSRRNDVDQESHLESLR